MQVMKRTLKLIMWRWSQAGAGHRELSTTHPRHRYPASSQHSNAGSMTAGLRHCSVNTPQVEIINIVTAASL